MLGTNLRQTPGMGAIFTISPMENVCIGSDTSVKHSIKHCENIVNGNPIKSY